MTDQLRLGTPGDEILDSGVTIPVPLQGGITIPVPAFGGDDLPCPPMPDWGGEPAILYSGISLPIP